MLKMATAWLTFSRETVMSPSTGRKRMTPTATSRMPQKQREAARTALHARVEADDAEHDVDASVDRLKPLQASKIRVYKSPDLA